MKTKPLAAATLAAALLSSTSAALAVKVEYRNADVEFAREIGGYYEAVPANLKEKMLNPRVIIVGDDQMLVQVMRETRQRRNDVAKYSSPTKYGSSYAALAVRGTLGYEMRTLFFNQAVLKNTSPEGRRNTVAHEMAHLWDFGPAVRPGGAGPAISDSPAFMQAFRADKKWYEEWMAKTRKSDPEKAERVRKKFGYFMDAPQEAFAEVVAMHVAPYPADWAGHNTDFLNVFENSSAYVQGLLTRNGIAWSVPPTKKEVSEQTPAATPVATKQPEPTVPFATVPFTGPVPDAQGFGDEPTPQEQLQRAAKQLIQDRSNLIGRNGGFSISFGPLRLSIPLFVPRYSPGRRHHHYSSAPSRRSQTKAPPKQREVRVQEPSAPPVSRTHDEKSGVIEVK